MNILSIEKHPKLKSLTAVFNGVQLPLIHSIKIEGDVGPFPRLIIEFIIAQGGDDKIVLNYQPTNP